MKAITISQPWATLLAAGATRYNVRSWRTRHRGRLAIYAGAKFPAENIDLSLHEEIQPLLSRAGYDYLIELPLRAVIGAATLVDCLSIGSMGRTDVEANDPSVVYGGFFPENWLWIFRDAQLLAQPIPAKGKLGIFSIPDSMIEQSAPAAAEGSASGDHRYRTRPARNSSGFGDAR